MTQDGRVLVGNLRGYDALGSLVLSECVERIFSRDAGVEEVPLGVYILRGDSMYVSRLTQISCRRLGSRARPQNGLGVADGRSDPRDQTHLRYPLL